MSKFADIRNQIQQIIDFIVKKEYTKAQLLLNNLDELLEEMFDFSDADSDLVEISRYQVLINQLKQKITN